MAASLRLLFLLVPLAVDVHAAAPPQREQTAYSFDPRAFPRYRMRVEVEPSAHRLSVEGSVEPPAALGAANELVFAFADDAQGKRFSLSIGGNDTPIEPQKIEEHDHPGELTRWRVRLPDRRGMPVRLQFAYVIERASSNLFSISDEVAFGAGVVGAWYPQLIDAGDSRMIGLGTLSLKATGGLKFVAPGGLAAEVEIPATTPGFFSFVAGDFRAVASASGRSRLYLLNEHDAVHEFVEQMDRTIGALAAEFGPFPDSRFDLIEIPTVIARQAGFDGASLGGYMLAITPYFDQPFNIAFFGHEIGHRWWGGLIRRRGQSGAFVLDESLAQYGSLRAVERLEGPKVAELYRRRGYPGYYTEYAAASYLARSLAGIDAALMNLTFADGFLSRRVADTKGMLAWDMISRHIGRERFAAFLRRFVQAHAYRAVTLEELLDGVRKLGPDARFVDQWFTRTGAPDIALDWERSGKRTSIRISQSAPFYDLRVPVVVCFGSDARRLTIPIRGATASHGLRSRTPPTNVVLDPAFEILRWTSEYREEAQAIKAFTAADIAFNYGRNDEAEAMLRGALAVVPEPDATGLRFRLLRGLGDVALSNRQFAAAAADYFRALAATAVRPEQVPEIWQGIAQARAGLGDVAGESAALDQVGESSSMLKRALHVEDGDPCPTAQKLASVVQTTRGTTRARAGPRR